MTQSIEELLEGPALFDIPGYQRPFSWTSKEAGKLLDDVRLSMEEARDIRNDEGDYFLGTILLMSERIPVPRGRGNGARATAALAERNDVIDGQQRLITLTILIAVLRDQAAERALKLRIDFRRMIEGVTETGAPRYRIEPHAGERDFLESYVLKPGAAGLAVEEEPRSPAEACILAVRDHFYRELDSEPDQVLFKIANYLMVSCHVAVITARTVDRAHRMFSVLNNSGKALDRKDILKAQILGQIPTARRAGYTERWNGFEALLGKQFEDLFSHIRAIEGRTRERVISGITESMGEIGGAEGFFTQVLAPYASILSDIARCNGPSREVVQQLRYFDWFASEDWVPPVMLMWKRVHADPARLVPFLAKIDRLTMAHRILGTGADRRQARMQAVTNSIRGGRPAEVEGTLEISREDLRNIGFHLRNLHARSQQTCKLLLMRVSDELGGAGQGLDPSEFTVEHVLPQRPARLSEWRAWFPNAEERESCTQSLGNLVLVTRGQNERARNKELARKLEAYFGSESVALPFLTTELKGMSTWGPEQVREREERILASIARIWGFDTGRMVRPTSSSATPPLQ